MKNKTLTRGTVERLQRSENRLLFCLKNETCVPGWIDEAKAAVKQAEAEQCQ